MAVYRLTRYPRQVELNDGTTVKLRPMVQQDVPVLIDFFAHLPEADRFFLKEDVASAGVIAGWGANLNYDRALPLLALDGERVVGDSVLFRHRGGYRQHLAGIRISVAPDVAGTNLVAVLMRELLDIAWDSELEVAELELVDQAQHQGRLRADDHEVDAFAGGEGAKAHHIVGRDRHAGRDLGYAGVAGRAEQGVAQGRVRDFPAQRVLASAAAYHQNPHVISAF